MNPLAVTYSYGLVVVSVMLAILAAYAAFGIADLMRRTPGQVNRLKWLMGGSAAMGFGIWSMHYMGMLAAKLPVPVFYYIPTVVWSLVLAMAASAVALFVATTGGRDWRHFAGGGLLMGGGIAGMHYMGMAAMRTVAMHQYSPGMVMVSVMVAVALSTVALWMISRVQVDDASGEQYRVMGAAVLMGLGIASMHYVAMAAVHFHADAMAVSPRHAIKVSLLGEVGVAVTALLVLLNALASASSDKKMYRTLQLAHEELAASQEALLKSEKELREVNALLSELSIRDGLTGLYNRRHFDERLDTEWRRVRRVNKPMALLMLDIDHFKEVNDRYGHQYGDDCLRDIARVLEAEPRRAEDMAARFGGEEFAVLLPGSGMKGALDVAERIRKAVMNVRLEHLSSAAKVITVSIGVTCYLPGTEDSIEKMISRADAALYEAKRAGRNCVVGIPQSVPVV